MATDAHQLPEGDFSFLLAHDGAFELYIDGNVVRFSWEIAEALSGLLAGYLEDARRKEEQELYEYLGDEQ